MAQTTVTIRRSGDYRVPDVTEVSISQGDTIVLTTEAGVAATVCLTAETAAILSPVPSDLDVQIGDGQSVSYQFAGAEPGNYCAVVQNPDWPRPQTIDCGGGASLILRLKRGDQPDWSGPGGGPILD